MVIVATDHALASMLGVIVGGMLFTALLAFMTWRDGLLAEWWAGVWLPCTIVMVFCFIILLSMWVTS